MRKQKILASGAQVVGQTILAVAGSQTAAGVPEGEGVTRIKLGADATPPAGKTVVAGGEEPAPAAAPVVEAAKPVTASPAADPSEAVKAQRIAMGAELTRVNTITALAQKYPGTAEIVAKAVTDGVSAEAAELLCLRHAFANPPKQNGAYGVTAQASGDMPEVLRCAVFMAGRPGEKVLVAKFKPEVINAAADLHLESVTDILRFAAGMHGERVDRVRADNYERMIRAAYSTHALSDSFSGLVNYYIIDTWGAAGAEDWRIVCPDIRPVRDFRSVEGLRLDGNAMLKDLAVGGKIENGTLSRSGWSIKAITKALMFGLTREQIINDDPGLLGELRTLIGFQYRQSFRKNVNAQITAGFTALESAQKKSLAFNADNLSKAVAYLARLAHPETKEPMMMEAAVLVVAPELADAARAMVQADLFISGNTTPAPATNVHKGRYSVFTNHGWSSATAWGILPAPQLAPFIQIAALNGNYLPTVEAGDGAFNQLGLEIRAYVDTGFGTADTYAILGNS